MTEKIFQDAKCTLKNLFVLNFCFEIQIIRFMMYKLLLTVFVLVLNFSALSQNCKFITVKGRSVIGPDGREFHMMGTNLGNWLVPEGYMFKFTKSTSPRLIQETVNELLGPDVSVKFWKQYLDSYITEADIHYLKSIGMNSIRIPFHYKLFTDEPYLGGRGAKRGFELMDRVIGWCRKEGLYVILDMHCAPGGQTGDNIDDSYGYPFLFENEESQKLTINIWRSIAKHYANECIVLGYDLLNEPIAHYFDKDKLNPLLEPLYRKITAAVRESDKNHLIFLGGAQWDSNFKPFGQPFDNKLVYTFHKYWTPAATAVIQDYLDFSKKYNVPLYCGETGENTDEWVRDFRKVLDSNAVGWHFWPYKKAENKRGIVEFPLPNYYDQVIQYAEAPRGSYEEIRKATPKNMDEIKQALFGFLSNCLFRNCTPNAGYNSALGFKSGY